MHGDVGEAERLKWAVIVAAVRFEIECRRREAGGVSHGGGGGDSCCVMLRYGRCSKVIRVVVVVV